MEKAIFMVCKKCRAQNPDTDKFCGECGIALEAAPAVAVVAGEDGVYYCARHKKEITRLRCGRCEYLPARAARYMGLPASVAAIARATAFLSARGAYCIRLRGAWKPAPRAQGAQSGTWWSSSLSFLCFPAFSAVTDVYKQSKRTICSPANKNSVPSIVNGTLPTRFSSV